MKILIKSATLFLPTVGWGINQDLYIDDSQLSLTAPQNFKPDRIIDASNQWVLPAMVDLHTYPCPPNQLNPDKAIRHELASALKSGFSQIVIPPNILIPKNRDPSPQIFKLGALSHQLEESHLNDLNGMSENGYIGFTMADKPIKNLKLLRQFYQYAASFNYKIAIQPIEPSFSYHGVVNEGVISERTGMSGVPAIAEAIAISQQLLLIEDTGITAHFSGVSTHQAVELISSAQSKGLKVTADTIMSHLHLTEIDCAEFDSNCFVYPPLRTEMDRVALLKGINDGVINAISSYHVPLTQEDKLAPFKDCKPGISSIDTFLSLGYKLVLRDELSFKTLINAISNSPRAIFNLPQSQDIIIFDPNVEWIPSEDTLLSKGLNNPFCGFPLPGKISEVLFLDKLTS